MNITFLYPSRRVGGAQLLFVRMAKFLSEQREVEVSVVDYNDGFLKESLKGTSVNILEFVGNKVSVNFDTTIITPLSNITDCRKIVVSDSNVNFLFWSIHPDGLKYALEDKGRKYFLIDHSEIKKKVRFLAEKGGILFMDDTNLHAISTYLGYTLSPSYLAIPLEEKASLLKKDLNEENGIINIGWLGRLSDDKINSLYNIIDRIEELVSVYSGKLHLHIIGDGEEKEHLLSYLKNKKCEYTYVGTLLNKNLEEYLIKNIDLGVAMGTSALEMGIRRIPVLLLDYSYSVFPPNLRYYWLFESNSFSLCKHVTDTHIRKHKFEDIIESFPSKREELGAACYMYVKNNHDISVICNQLIQHIKENKQNKDIVCAEVDRVYRLANPFLYYFLYGSFQRLRNWAKGWKFKNEFS